MEGFRNTVVQATDANRPTLVPNVLDGHPAIRFGGTHWLQSLAQVGAVVGDYPRVYVVGSYAAAGASFNSAFVDLAAGPTVLRGCAIGHSAADAFFGTYRDSLRYWQFPSTAGNNSIPCLFDGRNEPTVIRFAINGIDRTEVAGAGAVGLGNTPTSIQVGRLVDGQWPLSGDIFCIICVNNETASSHATIMNYLATKYPSLGLGTPKGILGPLLHADFDAADPDIVLNGSNVSSIPNRGTDTAAMVQATAANQPVYNATSFANGPGMTFDGVDDTMLCTFATPIPIGRRPYMWVVFKANSAAIVNQIPASMVGGPPAVYGVAWMTRTDQQKYGAQLDPGGGPSAAVFSATATETVNTHLIEVGFTTGGTNAFVLDGVPGSVTAAVSAPLAVAMTRVRAGAHDIVPSSFANCTIRRVIVANDLPSAAQITAMREYLLAQPYGWPPQNPPLPASAVEYWHSELGCTPSAWVGQIGARSLTGVGTPVVATDPGFFKGRVVGQTAITGGKYWSNTFGTALALTGSRPWIYCVARSRTLDAVSRVLVAGANGATGHGIRQRATNGSGLWNSAASVFTPGAPDLNAHRFATWLDGTNISLRVDASVLTVAYAPAMLADLVTVAVGQNPVAADVADASVAFVMICSSKPSDAEIAALDQWAQAYWGVP